MCGKMKPEDLRKLLEAHDSVYVVLTGVGQTYLCSTYELAVMLGLIKEKDENSA
jgi:hypothetical protein